MKRLFTLILAFAMALSLTACGGKTDNPGTPDNPPDNSTDNMHGEASPAPENTGPEVIPENAVTLYDGSYLDLDGEYASGTPCKALGGKTIDANRATVSFVFSIPQEDGSEEDVQFDMNVSSPTIFANIPAGVESARMNYMIKNGEYISANDYIEQIGLNMYEPGLYSFISLDMVGILVSTINSSGGPATPYDFQPYLFEIMEGQPMLRFDGVSVQTLDDFIGIYGDPAGVYASDKSSGAYVWKFAGAADVYMIIETNLSRNEIVRIWYARESEAFHEKVTAGGFFPSNIFDILTELGLYQ